MDEREPLRSLKGVGEKTDKLFGKLGLRTVGDLLRDFPREYDVYERPMSVSACKVGQKAAVQAVITNPVEMRAVKKLTVLTTTVQDVTGRLTLTWFNMPFLRSTLKRGAIFVFRGRVVMKNNRLTMEQPEIFTLRKYDEVCETLQPMYSLTAGLSNKIVAKMVRSALDQTVLTDWMPEEIKQKHGFVSLRRAMEDVHFPKNQQVFLQARQRLAYEEFFLFILCMQKLKNGQEDTVNHYPMKAGWKTEEVMDSLPYRLTNAQLRVWNEMEKDLASDRLMNRLIQGDVGSGKTILAFLAMIMAAENGYQSALMAPTEVLARQHFEDMCHLLEENGIDKNRVVLLTGSCSAREKRSAKEALLLGTASFAVGTHALIQDSVEYKSLGLVITDEQHRFGVRQREALSSKGYKPNIAVMSATPIPRTLAMILYGDLDISVVDEKPAKRLPIKNCVVNTSYRQTAYRFIEKELQAGHQAYIICPMVEASEEIEAENVVDYASSCEKIFHDYKVGLLHGQMRPADKDAVMADFASGNIQVLVSTTVVEVGVNVPNATVMMVENAERFGLAQLHQLRGRVGRGKDQSYCIFISQDDKEETARRLDILNKTNDGFVIADEDMKLRGPGDFFGIRQSGMLDFSIGDIYRDAQLLKEAAADAAELLQGDPDLKKEEHSLLAERVHGFMTKKLQDVVL